MFRLVLSILSLCFSQVSALEFQAFKLVQDRNLEVSDIHFSTGNVDFGFVLETEKDFIGSIKYTKDAKILLDIPINLNANERLSFPENNKYVSLVDPGTHSFLLYQDDKIIERRSIIVKADDTAFLTMKQSTDYKLSEAATETKSFELFEYSKFNPVMASAPKVRSIGSKIFKQHSNSVVLIATDNGGLGSGSVIRSDGLILTNWHVVGDAEEVLVIFRPKGFAAIETGENYIADVLKADQEVDLALLKLRHLSRTLSPISIASPDTIEIAEDVHAIGHPKQNYWTYTKGVISQIRPNYKWTGDGTIFHYADVLQTQTPINPGNSGGPLLDDQGKMVGVNSFGDVEADGLNYAVAATTVKNFIESISIKNPSAGLVNSDPAILGSYDTNDDGYLDTWHLDYDRNGILDCVKIDTNFDGEIDVAFIDKNENEIAEMILDYVAVDGKTVLVISIDENEDGIRDQIAYDYDMDGNIDKVEDA